MKFRNNPKENNRTYLYLFSFIQMLHIMDNFELKYFEGNVYGNQLREQVNRSPMQHC